MQTKYQIPIFFISLLVPRSEEFTYKLSAGPEKRPWAYRKQNRYDSNDRNTSTSYDFWSQAEHVFLEWPGNITVMDAEMPLVAWKWARARLVRSPCEQVLGMEIAAYAYKFVHFTWGGNRLTQSYCDPLRIPRKQLPQHLKSELPVIVALDLGFVSNALIVILEGGVVFRVGNVQKAYTSTKNSSGTGKLSFSQATGVDTMVNQIVTQSCCPLSEMHCIDGDTVVLYAKPGAMRELPAIYVSKDGGRIFQKVRLEPELRPSINLAAVLHYGSSDRLLLLGTDRGQVQRFIYKNAQSTWQLVSSTSLNFTVSGHLHAERLGQSSSYVAWDRKNIWYSKDMHEDLSPAVFYVNAMACKIAKINGMDLLEQECKEHLVTDKYPYLGWNALLAVGHEGKFGILTTTSMVLYGIDTKADVIQLLATAADLSALPPDKHLSIVPGFDRNNRLRLWYPPRYLSLPFQAILNGSSYETRLAKRILGKSLFPSDFINAFRVNEMSSDFLSLPNHLRLEDCQTSTLSMNGSLSQKLKTYSLSPGDQLDIAVTFYSKQDSEDQLMRSYDINRVNVRTKLIARSKIYEDKYWFRYLVRISPCVNNGTLPAGLTITLYTRRSLLCLQQPEGLIGITIKQAESLESDKAQFHNVASISKYKVTTNRELELNGWSANYFIFRIKSMGIFTTCCSVWSLYNSLQSKGKTRILLNWG